MSEKTFMILERSSQNLQKITKNGKTILEGVFAEFGTENRNGRIYEEKEYLPHLEYLKKDIQRGNLLGELDHPERFEVALGSVSHKITELWYDQQKRQILGRIEILEGTPKGQIAKSLLEAGVPLSISSRAAGTVNEDKTVAIQQIYTYDLVAKPGFEAAQLHSVNESANPKQALINTLVHQLNESSNSRSKSNLGKRYGIINENVSILDVTDKFPQVKIREEALKIINKNNESQMTTNKPEVLNEEAMQQWTVFIKKELSAINERLEKLESTELGENSSELGSIKAYIEKIRKIQEDSLNWQSSIAKAVNEVASYTDKLAEKSNKHYDLTQKVIKTVDHNAKTLNKTQDWTSKIANVTNAIGETVDHNAKMLNSINEWNEEIAKNVNLLHEWGTEKAKAINDMHEWVSTQAKAVNGIHEWTSSIAKNFNNSINWSEDMFGRAISKEDALKLVEYVELVAESKQNPELKEKINEMLKTHSITAKPLNESNIKGISVIDSVSKVGNVKVDTEYDEQSGVEFDDKTKTIISKIRNIKVGKGSLPKGHNDKLQMNINASTTKFSDDTCSNDPKDLKHNLKCTKTLGGKDTSIKGDGPKNIKSQNLKLDVKPETKLKENLDRTLDIQSRKSNLDEKLSKIVNTLEKEKSLDEEVKNQFPFTRLLNESDRKRFGDLDLTSKQKVAAEISKVPTTDSNVILKLWENTLANNKTEEALWLSLAPKVYREAYESAPQQIKENINARSEFYTLNTQYQIDNFWETSGIIAKPVISLNESVMAKTPEESEQKLDTFVASIGEQLKRYYQ